MNHQFFEPFSEILHEVDLQNINNTKVLNIPSQAQEFWRQIRLRALFQTKQRDSGQFVKSLEEKLVISFTVKDDSTASSESSSSAQAAMFKVIRITAGGLCITHVSARQLAFHRPIL